MPKFEKKYVHFIWSDELEGKKVFYADDIPTLIIDIANDNDRGVAEESGVRDEPFEVNGHKWRFVYYDPHYELKRAHEQGKKIECKRKGDAWEDWDYTPAPEWLDDHEYRIMQEGDNHVSHRELARWLAQGRGEWRWYKVGNVTPYAQVAFNYSVEESSFSVEGLVLVRKWEDSEWHEPTREYMGLEE